MSSLAVAGYGGCRPSATTELYSMEPGQTESGQKDRYLRMAKTIKRPPALAEELAVTRRSVTDVDASTVRPGDYHVPQHHRRVASTHLVEKPLTVRSEVAETFADPREEAEAVAGKSDEDFAMAFDEIDLDGSGLIEPRELRFFLRKLLGRNPTALHLDAFLAFFDKNRDGRISREELLEGLPKVRSFLRETSYLSRERAKPPQFRLKAPPEVIAGLDVRSRQQEDMGKYGENPWDRDMLDERTGGMRATTASLDAGTARITRHPPGYQGFVPESAAEGTRAHVHAFGANERDVLMNRLNLTETVARRMKGYTGFVPRHGGGQYDNINKPKGQFAPTEQAAADSIVEDYWRARAAATKK